MDERKELLREINKLVVEIESQRMLAEEENDVNTESLLMHKRQELEAIRDEFANESCSDDVIECVKREALEGTILKKIFDLLNDINNEIKIALGKCDYETEDLLNVHKKRTESIRNRLIEDDYSSSAKREALNELEECEVVFKKIRKKKALNRHIDIMRRDPRVLIAYIGVAFLIGISLMYFFINMR